MAVQSVNGKDSSEYVVPNTQIRIPFPHIVVVNGSDIYNGSKTIEKYLQDEVAVFTLDRVGDYQYSPRYSLNVGGIFL